MNSRIGLSEELRKESIKRFCDTFVIDSLVGNFDRHAGNWAYLSNNNVLRLAPAYDFGSTLFPKLSDEGMQQLMQDDFEMKRRCMVFPSPVLCVTKEKVGKVGYYDMLASNYDKNCTAALLRLYPKMDIDKIYALIDDVPLISETRKLFYKKVIDYRKSLILDRAYNHCISKEYDKDALNRILFGKSYNDKQLMIDFEIYDDPISHRCC